MNTSTRLERGQILVLFVFGLIGLLAFTALALDGGMVYADRRYDQSVADAAAMAGARAAEEVIQSVLYDDFVCGSTPVNNAIAAAKLAAIARATANLSASDLFPGVFDEDLSDDMGVEVVCEPAERNLRVIVRVASETRTSFAHLVFGQNGIRNEVISVVRLAPSTPLAYGNAIVSLNHGPCTGNDKGTVFGGGGSNDVSINIKQGGIFSNSCIERGGKFAVTVEDGSVNHRSGYTSNGNGSITPPPQQTTEMITVDATWSPVCGPARSVSDATTLGTAKLVQPGTYMGGIKITGGNWVFEEGLYCLHGNLDINGGNVTGGCTVAEYTGPNAPGPAGTCDSGGVTFYFQPDPNNGKAGEIKITGGPIVKLYAPLSSEADPEIPGMLFYIPAPQAGSIDIAGNSQSEFRGTILAPASDVKLTGTQEASADFGVQIIGWNVTVGGTSSVNITYDPSTAVVFPAAADQYK